ncbi:MAG: J domain-containing protein, partial [Proteobacteria bacterium]|nr:J domain-containing protein [Pseudomonadota bacterium]
MAATKKSYAIPCSSAFRDRVQALADRRGVNAGDLVRSVMLVVPPAAIAAMADPGEPGDH